MDNKPKFYRQRFLLGLLRVFNRDISKKELQKHSFLFSQKQFMGYDFIPYKYGCYSLQLHKDLKDLSQLGFVEITDKIKLKTDNPIAWLKPKDIESLFKYFSCNKHLNENDLIKFVYTNYPYYAINSKITDQICSPKMQQKITARKSDITKNTEVIYTIGYEGISLEAYINKLIKNDIKLLCDVRKNPFSRKFGFSYKWLNDVLPQVGIDYVHIPELGIESKKRQNLDDASAYKKLFDEYETILPQKKTSLTKVLNLQEKYRRIALTCFEKSHNECHRHCVSDYLANNYKTKTIHL